MTKDEGRYLGRVAALGCVLCPLIGLGVGNPAQIHHQRATEGMGQRAQHWLAIPLCPDCHTGPTGVHGDKTRLYMARVDEFDLLALTVRGVFTGGVL
jgi:hypothetical protein